MTRALLAGLFTLSLLMTGCVGSIDPARLPADTLEDHGWEQTRATNGEVAGGAAHSALYTYHGNASQGIAVLSANDVPFVDEASLLPALLEEVEAQDGVGFNKTGERNLTLSRLNTSITAQQYRVTNASEGEANALMFTPPCTAFVAVLGWGVNETGEQADGTQARTSPYMETLQVASNVVCR